MVGKVRLVLEAALNSVRQRLLKHFNVVDCTDVRRELLDVLVPSVDLLVDALQGTIEIRVSSLLKSLSSGLVPCLRRCFGFVGKRLGLSLNRVVSASQRIASSSLCFRVGNIRSHNTGLTSRSLFSRLVRSSLGTLSLERRSLADKTFASSAQRAAQDSATGSSRKQVGLTALDACLRQLRASTVASADESFATSPTKHVLAKSASSRTLSSRARAKASCQRSNAKTAESLASPNGREQTAATGRLKLCKRVRVHKPRLDERTAASAKARTLERAISQTSA